MIHSTTINRPDVFCNDKDDEDVTQILGRVFQILLSVKCITVYTLVKWGETGHKYNFAGISPVGTNSWRIEPFSHKSNGGNSCRSHIELSSRQSCGDQSPVFKLPRLPRASQERQLPRGDRRRK